MIVTDPSSTWGRAGLPSRDRLTSINGRAMMSWPEVRTMLTSARIGDTLRFEIARPDGPFRTSVVMSGYERPVVRIEEIPNATARQRLIRAGWLRS